MEQLDPKYLKRLKPEHLKELLRLTKRDQVAHMAIAAVLPAVVITEIWRLGLDGMSFGHWFLAGFLVFLTHRALVRYGNLNADRERIEELLEQDE